MNAPEKIVDSKRVPAMTVEAVARLYADGLTQAEVARALGTSQRSICLFMKRSGLSARIAAKRDQRGEKNSTWKGDAVKYKPAHNRVYAARGRPLKCERCGTTDPSRKYDWANMTGKYHEPSDYVRLCRSCHCKHDRSIRNLGAYAKDPKNGCA